MSQNHQHVRVEMSQTVLGQIGSTKHNGWQTFVTLDENRFDYHTEPESIWLSGSEKAFERGRGMIASQKSMLGVAWNSAGFHVADVFPKSGGALSSELGWNARPYTGLLVMRASDLRFWSHGREKTSAQSGAKINTCGFGTRDWSRM
jgi:hypothetical protein